MANANDVNSLELLLRPLRRELSAELASALIRLQADAEVQARYEQLADKNTNNTLSSEERTELRTACVFVRCSRDCKIVFCRDTKPHRAHSSQSRACSRRCVCAVGNLAGATPTFRPGPLL